LDAASVVAVVALLTASVCAGLVEPVCPEPLVGVNAAESDSGDPVAAKVVVHVAVPVDPLAVTGWLVQPEIAAPVAEKVTVPAGATVPLPLVVTVAFSATAWLVVAGDGLGVASPVVVDSDVVPPGTVAMTLLEV
jgi:hypothetical protein